MKPRYAACLSLAILACLATQGNAAVLPKPLSSLREADLIVVGTITQIRIESERSRIEGGFGDYDWGVYVTIAVDAVEQGKHPGPEIEFRCFRIKSRRSVKGYFSPWGHRPIPGKGTSVRAYLYTRDGEWIPALPNGITAPDANDDESVTRSRLADAPELAALQSRKYTYGFPIEIWVVIIVCTCLVVAIALFTRWIVRREMRVRPAK